MHFFIRKYCSNMKKSYSWRFVETILISYEFHLSIQKQKSTHCGLERHNLNNRYRYRNAILEIYEVPVEED